MSPSRIRQRLGKGEPILSAKISHLDPELIEMVASFGFDAIWMCLEHKRYDPSVIYAAINACRLQGVESLWRIKPANHADLLWLLEAGGRAIMVPQVCDLEEARTLSQTIKFPPLGRRGYDGVHADADFGRLSPAAYMTQANRDTVLAVQIEEPGVLPHIDAIAALPGVDILFVGPGDLTLSLGKFGKTDDPEVTAILRQVTESCRRHGKVAGIPTTLEKIGQFREMGFGFFNVVSDYRLITGGLKKLQADLTAAGFNLGGPPVA